MKFDKRVGEATGRREMRLKGYQIVVLPRAEEQGGGYFVTVPQLPGCMTDGKTRDEAISYAEYAIEAWIALAHDLGRDIPAPCPLAATQNKLRRDDSS